MIFRVDDVSANTDMDALSGIVFRIRKYFNAEVILCINLLAKQCSSGSVYPGVPFKDRENQFFYDVDAILNMHPMFDDESLQIASHGLLHADHSRLSKDAQEMSIVASCRLLNTNKFMPPFNRYNDDTESICSKYGFELIKPDGWKNLDFEPFDNISKNWYFHPWRMTVDSFEKKVCIGDGLVPAEHAGVA